MWRVGSVEGLTVDEDGRIFIGGAELPQYLDLRRANRHGLITGATGTGKTVTLQVLAEGFSNAGVPVFVTDIKGDLSGIATQGEPRDFLAARAAAIGMAHYAHDRFPAVPLDLFGDQGHPVRATVSEMGPLLLARLMNLTDAQEGALNIAFRIADEQGMLLLDLKDLQAMLAHIAENASVLTTRYGNVSKATVGAIQRRLLVLEQQGGDRFFGEPAFEIGDLMRTTRDGRGYVSLLAADRLMQSPRLYATFLLWLLSELFEALPEVGDPERPKLVFFFDEAHLLFDEAPDALVDKVEQVVRLIRSKGVGVYFVTQNPLDVPDAVSAQLGNRIQHALRAYTPREQKAVRAAAETFRPNPAFKTVDVIGALEVGEALVSTLDGKGVPSMVQRTLIRPPAARLGPLSPSERRGLIDNSPLAGHYDTPVDRESAFEMLQQRAAAALTEEPPAEAGGIGDFLGSIFGNGAGRSRPLTAGQRVARDVTRTVANRIAGQVAANVGRSIAGSMGSSIGRALVRGMLGSMLRR